MSPKLKKFIIGMVVSVVVIIVAIAGFSMFSNMTTTTVFDLRIKDAVSDTEILNREVYLKSEQENSFKIKLYQKSSASSVFNVVSSNSKVAKVTKEGSEYKVTYFAEGVTDIIAYNVEETSIEDRFTLTIKENIPLSFVITDEKADSANEVSVYADAQLYSFDFEAKSVGVEDVVNLGCLSILDFNRDVFESVEIDAVNSKLNIKARDNGVQSIKDIKEYITVQSKVNHNGEVVLNNFLLNVNVKGYYINDIQLVLSLSPNDNAANFIYGEGIIKEGETRIDRVVFTETINQVNAKVRVAYSNGTFKDITTAVELYPTSDVLINRPIGDYCIISGFGAIDLIYTEDAVTLEKEFTFFRYNTGTTEYNNFINSLYTYDDETKVYTFNYWDIRFERKDVVTNEKGEIVGFKN